MREERRANELVVLRNVLHGITIEPEIRKSGIVQGCKVQLNFRSAHRWHHDGGRCQSNEESPQAMRSSSESETKDLTLVDGAFSGDLEALTGSLGGD